MKIIVLTLWDYYEIIYVAMISLLLGILNFYLCHTIYIYLHSTLYVTCVEPDSGWAERACQKQCLVSAKNRALTWSTHRGDVCITFPLLTVQYFYTMLPIWNIKSFSIWEFFRIRLPEKSVSHMFQISSNLSTASFLLQCNRASHRAHSKCSGGVGNAHTGRKFACSIVLTCLETSIL